MTYPKQNPDTMAGASGNAGRQVSEANNTAIRRLLGLLPMIVLEVRIALDVARDLHLTGGCSVEDGKRLATAFKRLGWAAEFVADAEREATR